MFCICCVGIQDQSFNNFQNITMKLIVNETQMNYLCARNCANLKIQTHIHWVWILKGQVHGSAHAHLSIENAVFLPVHAVSSMQAI